MTNSIFRLYDYKDRLVSFQSDPDSDAISIATAECFNDNCSISASKMDHRPDQDYFGIELWYEDTSCGEPEKSHYKLSMSIAVNQANDIDNIDALKKFFV